MQTKPLSRAQDADRYAGRRMRERRLELGLTQTQMAEFAGVTYQQFHKYEQGINRVAVGRLHVIAMILQVDLNYFLEGFEEGHLVRETSSQRLAIRLVQLSRELPTSLQYWLLATVEGLVRSLKQQ